MAGITPDPKKRGFLLPPGCKDLHDVLQRQRPAIKRSSDGGWTWTGPTGLTAKHDEPIEGQISELSFYLLWIIGSNALMRTVHIQAVNQPFNVSISQGENLPMNAFLSLEIGTKQNDNMREFCAHHGLPLPADTGMPAQFLPGLPVSQIYRLAPLPADVSQAASLLSLLFREVAGMDEQTKMRFRYDEIIKPA